MLNEHVLIVLRRMYAAPVKQRKQFMPELREALNGKQEQKRYLFEDFMHANSNNRKRVKKVHTRRCSPGAQTRKTPSIHREKTHRSASSADGKRTN